MKERPILFSAPMVRALLAGTKTQTRRVVKSHRNSGDFIVAEGSGGSLFPYHSFDGETMDATGNGEEISIDCPYGQPGDRLWVRETFTRHEDESGFGAGKTLYLADMEGYEAPWAWTPSIFMPRHASRITLEVTCVRVERLQDISEADAKAEGTSDLPYMMPGDSVPRFTETTHVWHYRDLWESINGPGSWDANPWVWVVGFKRVTL